MRDYMRDDYGPRFPKNEREQFERLESLVQWVYTDLLKHQSGDHKEVLDRALSNIAEASHIVETMKRL